MPLSTRGCKWVCCFALLCAIGCSTPFTPRADDVIMRNPPPRRHDEPTQEPRQTVVPDAGPDHIRECGLDSIREKLEIIPLFPWEYIVLHHSALDIGSAEEYDRLHKAKGWDGLGYHFVIGNGTGSDDGEIEVGWRWTQQREGAHAKDLSDPDNTYNRWGIGICLVGNLEKGRPTEKQIASLVRLMKYLVRKCGVAKSKIIRHCDVTETECPGRNFPYEHVRADALK
jgi:N-acetylmuramoyl-L-alanine amidase